MIARSTDYVEYCRESAKHLRDVHDLALRGRNKQEITRQIQERILREVDLRPEDDLVDIGCGDATLLRMALTEGVRNATGLLATEEEVAVLRASRAPRAPSTRSPPSTSGSEQFRHHLQQRIAGGPPARKSPPALLRSTELPNQEPAYFWERFPLSQADFIAMVEAAGLKLVPYWQHEYLNTRHNYLFSKP